MNFADTKPVPDKKINILLMFSVTVIGAVLVPSKVITLTHYHVV